MRNLKLKLENLPDIKRLKSISEYIFVGIQTGKDEVFFVKVKEIEDRLKRMTAMIVTGYKGLNVKQLTEIRRVCRSEDLEFKVVKNTLARIALKNVGLEQVFESNVIGPTAFVFSFNDPIVVAKKSMTFEEDYPVFEVRGGVIEGKVLTKDEIKVLAKLPSRDVLIAQFVAGLNAPVKGIVFTLQGIITNFVRVLAAIADKKQGEQA